MHRIVNFSNSQMRKQRLSTKVWDQVLSVLPIYVRVRWAFIADLKDGEIVSSYPRSAKAPELITRCASIEDCLKRQKNQRRNIIPRMVFRKDGERTLLYAPIGRQHALVADLAPDTPLRPAKIFLSHLCLVLLVTMPSVIGTYIET